MLREYKKQDANQQEYGELDEDDAAAGEKRGAAVALVPGSEQALHDGLIGAMAGHGEKRAADQARPECVLGREVPGKIEDLQLVARDSGSLRDFRPAARNAVQQHEEGDGASGQVEEQLRYIGPNDGFHAAFEGVENGEGDDEDDGQFLRSAENDADDQSNGGNADALGNGARDEKCGGGDGAHSFAKTFFDQGVGGEKFATKVTGKKQHDNEDAADEVAEDQLEKGEISAVGDCGRADDGERGSFRGDDGEREGPPGGRPPAKKIIARILLSAAEANAKGRHTEQIADDNCQVQWMNAHGAAFPQHAVRRGKVR